MKNCHRARVPSMSAQFSSCVPVQPARRTPAQARVPDAPQQPRRLAGAAPGASAAGDGVPGYVWPLPSMLQKTISMSSEHPDHVSHETVLLTNVSCRSVAAIRDAPSATLGRSARASERPPLQRRATAYAGAPRRRTRGSPVHSDTRFT